MRAKDLERMAQRWEQQRPAVRDHRSDTERRADARYEQWRSECSSGVDCLPCLLDELE